MNEVATLISFLKTVVPDIKRKIKGSKIPVSLSGEERDQSGMGQKGIIGTATLIIFLAGVVVMVLLMFGLLDLIIQGIATRVHLGWLLVHVPQIQVEGMVIGAGEVPAFIEAGGRVAGNLYSTFRLIGVVVIAGGFVVIGLSYALEQFDVLSRGISEKMLSESVLIIILIFIFPYFFNASAVALNTVNEDVILNPPEEQMEEVGCLEVVEDGDALPHECVTKEIASAAGTVPEGVIGEDTELFNIGIGALKHVDPTRIMVTMITMTASIISVIIAFAVGIFKILAMAAFAAAFPLILGLRLIPFLRDVSQRLTSALIGVMLAGVIISLFFRIGFGMLVLPAMEGNALNWTFQWALGVGVLLASAGAFTITAPMLSGMSGMISGTLGRTMSGAIGGMVASGGAAAGGAAAGAARGGMQAVRSGKMKGMGTMGSMKFAGKEAGKSTLRGGVAGAGGSGVIGGMKRGGPEGKRQAMKDIGKARGPGQQSETNKAFSQEMSDSGIIVDDASSETNSKFASEGNAIANKLKKGDLNSDEAYRLYLNAKSRGSGAETKDIDRKAVRDHGEINRGEISEGLRNSIADMKQKGWGTKKINATLGRMAQNDERR